MRLLSDNLGSFLKVELHWVSLVFVCGETITLAPKPSGFTWKLETRVASGLQVGDIAVGVHPLSMGILVN